MYIANYFKIIHKNLQMKCHLHELYDIVNINTDIYNKFVPDKYIQIGGSKHKFTHENLTYMIHRDEDSDNINFYIFNNDNDDSPDVCAHLIINKKKQMIYVQGISNYKGCAVEGMPKTRGGSYLLQAVLAYINKIKKQYKLKYIMLRDNSYFSCRRTGKSVSMSALYMLTKGSTWYHKYGFVPFDPETENIDMAKYIDLKTNQKIVDIIPVKCTPIKELIMDSFFKYKYDDSSKKDLVKALTRYENMSVKSFMAMFMKEYDLTCDVFGDIYKQLLASLQMVDLHGTVYYKQL